MNRIILYGLLSLVTLLTALLIVYMDVRYCQTTPWDQVDRARCGS